MKWIQNLYIDRTDESDIFFIVTTFTIFTGIISLPSFVSSEIIEYVKALHGNATGKGKCKK